MILHRRARERIGQRDILKRLTTRYDNLFQTSFPYSAGIHQAPLAVQATLLNARRALEEGFAAAVGEFQAVNQRLSATEDARGFAST